LRRRSTTRTPSPPLHDALPILAVLLEPGLVVRHEREPLDLPQEPDVAIRRVQPEPHPPERIGAVGVVAPVVVERAHPGPLGPQQDRKSTRLNSSHLKISYAVFC